MQFLCIITVALECSFYHFLNKKEKGKEKKSGFTSGISGAAVSLGNLRNQAYYLL